MSLWEISIIESFKLHFLRRWNTKCRFGFGICIFISAFFFSFLFFRSSVSRRQNLLFTTIAILFKYCNNTVHVLFMRPTAILFRKKNIKNGPTVLFTNLKIILLQYFQFSISAKISSIQTDQRVSHLRNAELNYFIEPSIFFLGFPTMLHASA